MCVLVKGDVAAVRAAVEAGKKKAREVRRFLGSTVLPSPSECAADLPFHSKGFCMGNDPDQLC